MWTFIAEYWIDFAFGLVITGVGCGLRMIIKRLKELEIVKQGMRELLKDRIIQAYNYWTDKGYCPIYALDSIQGMYDQYHALGGNGTITQLVNELKELTHEKPKNINNYSLEGNLS